MTFINSDADMIRVYLAWLALLGVKPDRLRYRVMIHESADVEGAEGYWAAVAGIDTSALEQDDTEAAQPQDRPQECRGRLPRLFRRPRPGLR